MPAPIPTEGESEPEFMSRCQGDEIMMLDIPDEAQRASQCQQAWADAHGGEGAEQPPIEPQPA